MYSAAPLIAVWLFVYTILFQCPEVAKTFFPHKWLDLEPYELTVCLNMLNLYTERKRGGITLLGPWAEISVFEPDIVGKSNRCFMLKWVIYSGSLHNKSVPRQVILTLSSRFIQNCSLLKTILYWYCVGCLKVSQIQSYHLLFITNNGTYVINRKTNSPCVAVAMMLTSLFDRTGSVWFAVPPKSSQQPSKRNAALRRRCRHWWRTCPTVLIQYYKKYAACIYCC